MSQCWLWSPRKCCKYYYERLNGSLAHAPPAFCCYWDMRGGTAVEQQHELRATGCPRPRLHKRVPANCSPGTAGSCAVTSYMGCPTWWWDKTVLKSSLGAFKAVLGLGMISVTRLIWSGLRKRFTHWDVDPFFRLYWNANRRRQGVCLCF